MFAPYLDIIMWFESLVSGQYWCTQVSSPLTICSKKSSPWSLKRRRKARDAPFGYVHTQSIVAIAEPCRPWKLWSWATKMLPSSDQSLNFKWIKRHHTIWSYLVPIK
jgi:hypothetical protein